MHFLANVITHFLRFIQKKEYPSVRVKSEDFVKLLSYYCLNSLDGIGSITNELQLSLFVYLNIDTLHNEDEPIRALKATKTTLSISLTCHYQYITIKKIIWHRQCNTLTYVLQCLSLRAVWTTLGGCPQLLSNVCPHLA